MKKDETRKKQFRCGEILSIVKMKKKKNSMFNVLSTAVGGVGSKVRMRIQTARVRVEHWQDVHRRVIELHDHKIQYKIKR